MVFRTQDEEVCDWVVSKIRSMRSDRKLGERSEHDMWDCPIGGNLPSFLSDPAEVKDEGSIPFRRCDCLLWKRRSSAVFMPTVDSPGCALFNALRCLFCFDISRG